MKKVMVITIVVITGIFLWNYLFFYKGILYIPNHNEVRCLSKAEGERLYVDYGTGFEEIEIRGVNLGFGKPGYFATEDAITKEEYLRWFEQIQELGANVVRIYKKAPVDFYEAFYAFLKNF